MHIRSTVFCCVQLCPVTCVPLLICLNMTARQVCTRQKLQLQEDKNTILEIISLHDGFWKCLTDTNLIVQDHLFLDGPTKLPKFYYSMIDKSVWLLQHLTSVCLTLNFNCDGPGIHLNLVIQPKLRFMPPCLTSSFYYPLQ